jgi:putative ABC transport system permease protein
MIKNYLKIAWRNLMKNKIFSFINILGLTIGITACMMIFLFKCSSYSIGVRKVLGASVFGIVYLLSGRFTRLIIIAMAIAIPVSWWAIGNWLKGFAYRININWTIFLVACGTALLIALLTVSYESVKVAVANPVKSLRTE